MHIERYVVDITTNSSGAGEGYTPVANGAVLQIQYDKTDFDNGSTMTVTGERTGLAIWSETGVNADALRAPRQPLHTQAGAAMLHASGGTALPGLIHVADERIKIAVTSGGNVKSGRYWVTVGG